MRTATSQNPSWYDLRCCYDVKQQQTNFVCLLPLPATSFLVTFIYMFGAVNIPPTNKRWHRLPLAGQTLSQQPTAPFEPGTKHMSIQCLTQIESCHTTALWCSTHSLLSHRFPQVSLRLRPTWCHSVLTTQSTGRRCPCLSSGRPCCPKPHIHRHLERLSCSSLSDSSPIHLLSQ